MSCCRNRRVILSCCGNVGCGAGGAGEEVDGDLPDGERGEGGGECVCVRERMRERERERGRERERWTANRLTRRERGGKSGGGGVCPVEGSCSNTNGGRRKQITGCSRHVCQRGNVGCGGGHLELLQKP